MGDLDVRLEIAPGSGCCDECGLVGRGRWLHPDGKARIQRGVARRAAAAVLGNRRRPRRRRRRPRSPSGRPTTACSPTTTPGRCWTTRCCWPPRSPGSPRSLTGSGWTSRTPTMPALTGNRDRDWNAFAAVYQKVTSQLPANPAQRQELAAATMTGMIASLHDNHARWSYPAPSPGSVPGDLGIMTSPGYLLADTAPQEALPPLFITAVAPGSPPPATGCGPGTSSSPSTAPRRSPMASFPKG